MRNVCYFTTCSCTEGDTPVGVVWHAQRHRGERYNVGAAWTRLGAGRSGARVPVGARNFPLLQNVNTGPSTLLFNKCLGSLPRVMRPRCEVNHSPLSSAEVKNEWSYTSIPPYMPACRGQRKPFFLKVFIDRTSQYNLSK